MGEGFPPNFAVIGDTFLKSCMYFAVHLPLVTPRGLI